jgi:transcriptional regulator with GAF, ATPase, and Fis domain/tetratricopeptide (TPR) repeat protein
MSQLFAGRFVLLRRLGQGGMGHVFLARDTTTGAECALKRLGRRGMAELPAAVRREFEALTRIRHPAIVAVHELGVSPEGTPYCTMEYVPGLPADEAVARGDWPAIFFVGAQVAHGLEALHAAGVVHGDLKPSNLLVVPGEPGALPHSVRLVDFGLAALMGRGEGAHTGTAGFTAPEVVTGATPNPATDLYALGATLYALAAQRLPFEGEDIDSILRRQKAGPPSAAALEEAGAPAALVRMVMRLIAPEPGERPRSAREVRLELERAHPAARRPLVERLQTASVVGRERELARLESNWARTRPDRRLTILSGDPGAGKSALLYELGARASLAGRTVIQLSCGSMEGHGAVAIALLRRMAAEAGAKATEDLKSPAARAILSGGLLRESDLDELADAALRWSEAMDKRSHGILVLIDDADRLDDLSRAWIRRLISRPQGALDWVWARRPASEVFSQDERVLLDAGLATHVEVGPLDREAVERLVAARLMDVPPPALVDFLWKRCGGHAGLTVETLASAARSGAIRETETGLAVDETALQSVGIPSDYESSLINRLEALPAPARTLAEALAVWDGALDQAGMRALSGTAEDKASEELLDAGLARRTEEGVLLWPPVLAERISRALGQERRRELHRLALERPALSHRQRFRHLSGAGEAVAALEEARLALDESPDDALARSAAELAERDVPERAAEWHERAARILMARRLYTQSIPHLEKSLSMERNGEDRGERWVALCRSYLRVGRLDDASRIVDEALRHGVQPALQARLLADDATRLQLAGLFDRARTRAHEALAAAETSGDAEAEGVAAAVIAYVTMAEGSLDEAESFIARVVAARQRPGATHEMRGIGLRAHLERMRQRLGAAESVCREAISLARRERDRHALEEYLMLLGAVLTETAQWKEAVQAYEEMSQIALEDARPSSLASAMAGLGILTGLMGDVFRARRQTQRAIRLCRRYRPRTEAAAWRALAHAHRISGEMESAERAARRGLRLTERGSGEDAKWCVLELAEVLVARGQSRQARKIAEARCEQEPRKWVNGDAALAIVAGRAALREGDIAGAIKKLEVAKAWLGESSRPYLQALTWHLQAEIAFTGDKPADAFEIGERALSALSHLPAPADLAIAALELSRLASARSEPSPRVAAWLELAATTYERLGDQRGRLRTLSLQVEWLKRAENHPLPAGTERGLIERVSWLLNSLTDLHELTQRAMRMAVEQLDAERGVLLLLDRSSGQLKKMAEIGSVDAASLRKAVGYSRQVVERVTESGGSLLITEAPLDPRARSDSVRNLQLQSILCVPLFLGGAVIGAVYLDDSRRTHRFGEDDRGLLEGFAHLMAVAIEKARGHEEIERMKELLEGENLSLRQEVGARFQFENVVGSSSEMRRVLALVEHAARVDTTVLITGENGTGKELIARTLHHGGQRRSGPFVSVNCGAIPETLLESELFGILPHVATGVRAREGRFAQANGGTLFLDEIGEMPPHQQVALLSAIANREVTPLGGGKPIPVDVRIVAATNCDLRQRIQQGRFREDLFFRLAVIEMEMPPLRERKSDIPDLARAFLQKYCAAQGREVPKLSPDFMAVLMQSDWPGNVRELQNYIERVLAMHRGTMLKPEPVPRDLQERASLPRPSHGRGLVALVEEMERKLVGEALARAAGNQSQAARILGLPEQSFRYRLRKFGLANSRHNRRSRQK